MIRITSRVAISEDEVEIKAIRAQGYSESFMRLWDYYLAYCIGGFDERHIGTVQMLMAGPEWRRSFPFPRTEAARGVIDSAFSTCPGLNRVHARADHRNTASQRVMEKVGMMKEGVLRQSRIERGEVIDEARFAILRSEWAG